MLLRATTTRSPIVACRRRRTLTLRPRESAVRARGGSPIRTRVRSASVQRTVLRRTFVRPSTAVPLRTALHEVPQATVTATVPRAPV